MSDDGYYRRTEAGGFYGGLGFWIVSGIVWLCVMVIMVWVALALLAAFVVGLGIWSVFEYRRQARAGLHRPPAKLEAEVELVERKLREREQQQDAEASVHGLA